MRKPRVNVELCEGRRVIDPRNMRALEPGKVYEVILSQFWMRRLADEDVRLHEEKNAPKEATSKKSKKKKSRG